MTKDIFTPVFFFLSFPGGGVDSLFNPPTSHLLPFPWAKFVLSPIIEFLRNFACNYTSPDLPSRQMDNLLYRADLWRLVRRQLSCVFKKPLFVSASLSFFYVLNEPFPASFTLFIRVYSIPTVDRKLMLLITSSNYGNGWSRHEVPPATSPVSFSLFSSFRNVIESVKND